MGLNLSLLKKNYFPPYLITKSRMCINFTKDVQNIGLPNIPSTTVKSDKKYFEPATADEVRTIILKSPKIRSLPSS